MGNHAMVSATANLVFVVDDDDRVRTAFTRLFRSAGYNVLTFACAKDFLNCVDLQRSPACLVLDLQMPGMTGLELQRELEPAGIPIIFVTGHGDIESGVEAMKAGAVDFFTKPVLDAQLLSAVDQALQHATRAFKVRCEKTEIVGRINQLSPRERQVMALVLTGRSNKQVASELGAAETTIKIHRRRVMQKMRARSLVELLRLADKAGFSAIDEQSQH
jgi:FixJ family two-component response regulator